MGVRSGCRVGAGAVQASIGEILSTGSCLQIVPIISTLQSFHESPKSANGQKFDQVDET